MLVDRPPMDFWNTLDEAEQTALTQAGRSRRFRHGAPLCYQGEPADQVLIIRTGWAKVSVADADGRERLMALRGPGELIGEMGTLGDDARNATVTALQSVTAMSVSGSRFIAFLASHPGAWQKVVRTMVDRLVQADRRIVKTGTLIGAGRLALFLLELAERNGRPFAGGGIEVPPLSQAELGSYVDASRETVARAFKDWRAAGIIATGWRQTVILDPARLRLFAESLDDL
ncbi:Crp/Fnr family transcriptional regulator [Actinocorallia longicatena]|uniref:Crp/Fnr family transcriptional regulator n=1 Tax=Actinocorallia longicatena TaxID=111803 RepID=A0ABP6Q5X5_9ACTN